MGTLIMIGQLLLSLSILIVLHELGHFAPARWFGTRVEKFYLFFDWGGSLFKKKIGETEYGIGWLPLGGYVKISGMVDESFDTEQLAQEPQPWEFRSKPAWQRLIIMLGGVTVNFILGLFLFGMIFWQYGEEYLPTENVTAGIYADSLGQELGLQDGDQIVSIGGTPFERFNDRLLIQEVVFNNAREMVVKRAGSNKTLPIDERFVGIFASGENKDKVIFGPRYSFVAGKVAKDSPAEAAGIKVEDKITAFNGRSTPYINELLNLTQQNKSQTVTLSVDRDGQQLELPITLDSLGKMGIYPHDPGTVLGTKRIDYSLGEAIPKGISYGWGFLGDQIAAFGQMFKGNIKAKDSLGGFGTIGKMFGSEWVWERFWRMTAILSLILAFMNLLPIPALDGGHVMFLLYEMISGRKPSDKFLEYATMVGFIIVLGLVLYANGMDIIRAWFN